VVVIGLLRPGLLLLRLEGSGPVATTPSPINRWLLDQFFHDLSALVKLSCPAVVARGRADLVR
jgi:hypothetical protein